MIEEILKYNREFVAREGYREFITSKYPDKKIAIVTCMDTRLVALLPAALGIRNGDVKIIKNAGATITNPFDSTMRSLLIAVYELGVNEIMVIGHTGCGVQGMDAAEMLELMKERGVDAEHISLMKHCGIDLDKWLSGFDDTDAAVAETVDLIANHPLMPPQGVRVQGFVMDSVTGLLRRLGSTKEYTPENIDRLAPGEIFVFGSNLAGHHGGGAARVALDKFGAVWGQGVGLQGRSYAIPTMQGGVDTIRPYVDGFIDFAKNRPDLKFYVTRIGCGIAGFADSEIAPLFAAAVAVPNIVLPESFAKIIAGK